MDLLFQKLKEKKFSMAHMGPGNVDSYARSFQVTSSREVAVVSAHLFGGGATLDDSFVSYENKVRESFYQFLLIRYL